MPLENRALEECLARAWALQIRKLGRVHSLQDYRLEMNCRFPTIKRGLVCETNKP